MAVRNGYFQLENKEDGTYVILYPPVDGGRPIDINELSDYLSQMGISGYDIKLLNAEIQTLSGVPGHLKLSDTASLECNEMMRVRTSQDGMRAVARFYSPSTKGMTMAVEEIMQELKTYRITEGILTDILKKFVISRPYCTDIPVAKGTPAVQGADAYITYHFDTNPTGKPKQLEDGSVDFHDLNIFTRVSKGDLLATLTPAKPGIPGVTIFGAQIVPAKVKHLVLKQSRNVQISEDKLKMYSAVSGDVRLEGDSVFVSNTYTVAADVDASTGDISYDGDVVVTGNVRTGFTVRAKGSVQVNGVVEGAKIYSGDSIVLKRGMQGMSRGYLEAAQNIVAKFVESGTLVAGNNITVGSLLHCKAHAGNDIVVSGRKAFIIGGETEAGHMIDAHAIGNQMETVSVLRAGVTKEQLERLASLTEENEQLGEEVVKFNKILEAFKLQMSKGARFTPDQVKKIQAVGVNQKQLVAKRQQNIEEIAQLNDAAEKGKDCIIKVADVANPGTELFLNGNRHIVKTSDIRRCRFRLKQGEIQMEGY